MASETSRRRSVALIDRAWLGDRSALLIGPLAMPPVDTIRALLADFMAAHPDSPLAARIEDGRWVTVPADARAAHLDRVLIGSADPDFDDIEAHIAAHQPAVAPDLPVVLVVSPRSILVQSNHAVGDAATLTRLLHVLSRADRDGLHRLADRARTPELVRAMAGGLRAHRREWAAHLRHRAAPPPASSTGPSVPRRPAFTGAVLSNAGLRDLTRWRNANARGVSLTSVLTSAAYLALRERGLPVHDKGFYTLIDLRAGLPAGPEPRWGNLAKSLYLAADLADPASVETALKVTRETDRALPAAVIGAVTSAAARPRPPAPAQPVPSSVVLTFNSMPSLPGLGDLPWLDDTHRRYYGFGPSSGPGGITVFAVRLRNHLELTASFDENVVPAESVHSALLAMADPATLPTAA